MVLPCAQISLFIKRVRAFITFANQMMSKAEHRRHPSSPRSIVSYLSNKELTLEDRELIAEITEPNGWSAKFNDEIDLTADELEARSKILRGLKKYPAVKVN